MSFPTRKIRTARSAANRRTLQPSVRDFSDQVIGCYPEDGGLYLGIANPTKAVGCNVLDPTRRQSPRFTGSIVTYSTLEAAAHSHLPATFDTPRNSAISPEELHRRHVAKSARLRSRLSGNKQLQRTHILDSPVANGHRRCWNPPGSTTGLYPSPRPASGGDIKRPWSSDRPSKFRSQETARSRPATTGRYFNSSNGLRTSTTLYRPLSSCIPSAATGYRPITATFSGPSQAWVTGPGLHINKIKLSCKRER
ncbi:hypothetical protein ElyMa_001222900 [Elysia marginata]|uniref:Uncharacterized protein n=1 Tax=Elysia marginata TaxID=1093978 RepID=A0AAV4IBI9_9GAST|nr:hypothetical protein ElyMa_001222900 [Elysia marginata]